ncbi:MAG: cytochrome c [Myxococcota bacterium]
MKVISLLIASSVLLGCGPSPEPGEGPTREPIDESVAEPAAESLSAPVSDTASNETPAAPRPADPVQGETLYQTYCASCHGPRGDADGPLSQALDPRPAKHSDGSYMNGLGNEHLLKVVRDGGVAVGKSPLMAPWGTILSEEQIRDLVAFTRSLAQPPYRGPAP